MADTSTNLGIDEQSGQLTPMPTRNADTLHWGFSLQYSMFYLTSRYTPGQLPKKEPLYQFIPSWNLHSTPRAERRRRHNQSRIGLHRAKLAACGRSNIPANSEGGSRVGVRAHLFLFLDDLIPAVFGKPLFGR